jgi:peptidoglycan/LPS O-acetylase OafA/YrhL
VVTETNQARPDPASPFPGFDGLRLLAAFGVLVSHGMLMPTGTEPLEALPRTVSGIGVFGVYTFFIISGFLLARSLAREPDALRFAVNRVLRIYPGLIACALVTAFGIGLLGTALPWRDYLAHDDAIGYVGLTAQCLCARGWLPGVFGHEVADELRSVVNGSLWSLSYEVLSYTLLLALWLALRSVRATVLALVALALVTQALPLAFERLAGVAFTLPYFAGGALMYLVHERFGVRGAVALACAAGVAASAWFGGLALAYSTLGAYVVVYLGTRPNPGSALSARVGDLSYGVYLYGWPVQQLVKQATQSTDPWLMLALSAVITWACAWASYRIVERPALRLKAPLAAALRRLAAGAGSRDPARERARRTGATAAFLLGTAIVLLSPWPLWWYVSASLLGLAAATAGGALLAAAAARGLRRAKAG